GLNGEAAHRDRALERLDGDLAAVRVRHAHVRVHRVGRDGVADDRDGLVGEDVDPAVAVVTARLPDVGVDLARVGHRAVYRDAGAGPDLDTRGRVRRFAGVDARRAVILRVGGNGVTGPRGLDQAVDRHRAGLEVNEIGAGVQA